MSLHGTGCMRRKEPTNDGAVLQESIDDCEERDMARRCCAAVGVPDLRVVGPDHPRKVGLREHAVDVAAVDLEE